MQDPIVKGAAMGVDLPSSPQPSPPYYREIPEHFLIFERNENGQKIKLGEGGFGVVYKGTCNLPGYDKVAIKRARRLELGICKRDQKELRKEAAYLYRIRHPDIVTMYGLTISSKFIEDQLYCLVMEYMEMGSLDELMEKVEIPWEVKTKMLEGISRGLAYISNQDAFVDWLGDNIKHADIKARNILVDEFFRAKITDLGLCRIQDITCRTTHIYFKGTLTHTAPELIDMPSDDAGGFICEVTEASEVYSFGVTIFEVLAEKKPPKDSPEYGHRKYRFPFPVKMSARRMRKFINREMKPLFTPEQRSKIPDDCPTFLIKIMEKCCEVDPRKRPTFKEITQELANSFESSGMKKNYYCAMSKLYQKYEKQIPREKEFREKQDEADHHSRTYSAAEYLKLPKKLRNLKDVQVTIDDWRDLQNEVTSLLEIAKERSVSCAEDLEKAQEDLTMQLKYFYCERTPVTLDDIEHVKEQLKSVTGVLTCMALPQLNRNDRIRKKSIFSHPVIRNNYVYLRYNIHPNKTVEYFREAKVIVEKDYIYCKMKRDEVEKIDVILKNICDLMPEGLEILASCMEKAGYPDVAKYVRKGHIMERLFKYEVQNILIYNMKPRDVIEKLFTALYLNEDDKELINQEPRTSYKVMFILDAIERGGPPALEELIKILNDTNQTMLAKQLMYVPPDKSESFF